MGEDDHGNSEVVDKLYQQSESIKQAALDWKNRNAYQISASSAGFSAGNFATITINEIPVYMQKNENGHYRGLHIAVINPENGEIVLAQVFDTYETSEKLD